MNEGVGKAQTRRVLVALEADGDSSVLEAAARLAAGLEAELVALCIEDSDLVQAASLPVTRLVHSHASGPADLDATIMRRALRAWSTEMRRTLERVAASWRVKWSFQTAAGRYAELIQTSFRRRDLLALSSTGRHVSHAGDERRLLIAGLQGTVFTVGRLLNRAGPVAVFYQGNVETLQLALTVAGIYRRDLAVIALGETDTAARGAAESARRYIDAKGRSGHVSWQSTASAAAIGSALRAHMPDIVVFDRRSRLGTEIEQALRDVDCSVLALA